VSCERSCRKKMSMNESRVCGRFLHGHNCDGTNCNGSHDVSGFYSSLLWRGQKPWVRSLTKFIFVAA